MTTSVLFLFSLTNFFKTINNKINLMNVGQNLNDFYREHKQLKQ